MSYAYPEIRNFVGLHLQANSFEVPDGAMEDAKNVVMTKDAIISKRRGFYEYSAPNDTLNNLVTFNQKLLAIFTNGVSVFEDTGVAPNETGDRTILSGETFTISDGRTSRPAEANKNLYLTTDNGVFKVESTSSAIFKAGVAQALYLRGNYLAANGPVAGGSATSDGGQVAYRVVFGRRDSNDNLLLSSPSDILGLTNAKEIGVSWARVSNVVTVTSGVGHNLIVGMIVSVSNSAGGAPDVVSATYTITATTSTTYSFSETAADAAGTLDYATTRTPRLEYGIPSEINSVSDNFFVQIYRSTQTVDVDATPSSDYKLASERLLTAEEIARGFGTFDDTIDDILLGAELYTNPNSREGELQANERPPLCEDIALYKEHMFYANTTSRHFISLDVIDADALTSGDYIEIKTVDSVVRRYVARSGAGNQLNQAEAIAGTTTITITFTGHGFAVGDTIYISNVVGTIAEGEYAITGVTATTFTFIVASGETATDAFFQGRTTILAGTSYQMFSLDTASLSLAVKLRNTAQGLVKAIDVDQLSDVYAQYVSGVVGVPGKMRLQAKGFGGAIQIRASSATVGAGFIPALTTAFAGTESSNDNLPNALFISKPSEPEAVPLVNFLLVGARNKGILRIKALRDSLIVVKKDGVFRITGDVIGGFVSTPLDTTVICVASNSVDVINNQVIMLSNQGFCLITESSVQIISRVIEDVIQPIVGLADIEAATSGIGYETDRIYICATLSPGGAGAPTVTYCYNIINGAWSTWDEVLLQGAIGPRDRLHTINLSNKIQRQRKTQTKLDFTGQNYVVSVTALENTTTVTLTSVDATPQVGWVVVYNGVINRIVNVTSLGNDSYSVAFENLTSIEVTGAGWGAEPWGEFPWGSLTPIMYASYETRIKLAPFHGGMVGRFKQFSQMQLHNRGGAISGININYSGNSSSSSGTVFWTASGISSEVGWGLGFWGEFPWGDDEGINIVPGTLAGAIVRVYVPIRQQRATFIQPILTHERAAEEINLQAVAFAVRAFQERVTT